MSITARFSLWLGLVCLGVVLLGGPLRAGTVSTLDGKLYEGKVGLPGNDTFIIAQGGSIIGQVPLKDVRTVTIDQANQVVHGLTAQYYEGGNFEHFRFTKIEPNLDLDWQSGSQLMDGVPSDFISAHYSADLVPKYTERYHFDVYCDDTCKVWIDDKLVLDRWDKGYGAGAFDVNLIAGHKHSIRVDYSNHGGPGSLRVSWKSPSQAEEVIPQSAFWTTKTESHSGGLEGQYYSGENFDHLVATRLDAQVNFFWDDNPPVAALGHDHYSVRWTGLFKPAQRGHYTFYVASDDGSRLFVNGKKLVDQWGDQIETERSGTIMLHTDKPVPIRLEYFQATNAARVRLSVQRDQGPKIVIPQSDLLPPPLSGKLQTGISNGLLTADQAAPAEWSCPTEHFSGVGLTDGTMLAGKPLLKDGVLTLQPAVGAARTIPMEQVAIIVPIDISSDLLPGIPGDKTGVLLSTGDFSEGTPVFDNLHTVTIESLVFGPMSLNFGHNAAVVVVHPAAPPAKYSIEAADGSVYVVGAARVVYEGIEFRQSLIGPMTLPASQFLGLRNNDTPPPAATQPAAAGAAKAG